MRRQSIYLLMDRLPKILNPLRQQLGLSTADERPTLRQRTVPCLPLPTRSAMASKTDTTPAPQSTTSTHVSQSGMAKIKLGRLSGISLTITQQKRPGLEEEIRAQYSTLAATQFAAISPALSRHLM